MPTPKLSEKELQKTVDKFKALGIQEVAHAAKKMNMDPTTLRRRLRAAGYSHSPVATKEREFDTPELPSESRELPELIQHRRDEFKRTQSAYHSRKLIDINIKKRGPIGILWAGDAHLDNRGCDFNAVERDCQIINETDGMYGAVLGDTVDGWVGRLTKLYANAGTTANEGLKLAEWYFAAAPWLFVLGGNHDTWLSSDALAAYAKQAGTIYEPHSLRVNLKLPSGHQVRCHARHQFPGSSQWNKAHSITKYQIMGTRDHIAVCGHIHVSAYNILRDPTSGIAMHSVQVASYKVHDEYATERGFIDQHLSPSAVTVINTNLPETDPSFVTVWWSPEEGADYLTFLRSRQ